MAGPSQTKDRLFPLVLVIALLFALVVFPSFGALIGILSPFPIIFLYLQRGRQVGGLLIALVFLVLLLLIGANQAVLFLAEYALMALLLAELIRFRLPVDQCIGVSALASSIVSIVVLLFIFGDQEISIRASFEEQIRGHFAQSMKAFESLGEDDAEVENMKAFAEKAAEAFAASYMAFLLIGSFISTAANYALVRIVWLRLYGPGLFSEEMFAYWVCPENLVWGFILSGAGLFLGQGMVAEVGLNVFLVMIFIYFVQGLSIVVYFLKARNVSTFLWFVSFILILIQPLLIGFIAGLGVFDIWIDFRKLRNASAEDMH